MLLVMKLKLTAALLVASCSASCFDGVQPGQALFDLSLDELVLRSAPPQLKGKGRQSSQSTQQSPGDGCVLFHSDYLTEVDLPREQCDSFLDKLAALVSRRITTRGRVSAGEARGINRASSSIPAAG
jgi:hypothetical protein